MSLGGGLEQPVKPGRLKALYTRAVKRSIAPSLSARITGRPDQTRDFPTM